MNKCKYIYILKILRMRLVTSRCWHDCDPVSAQFQYPGSDQCQQSVPFWLAWLWANAGGVGSVSVPRLGPVLAMCYNSLRHDCGPIPAVLAAGLGPVYLGRFWGVIHLMSMPSLATAAGPSYFFRPAGSRPLSGQTALATWDPTQFINNVHELSFTINYTVLFIPL